MAGPLSAFPENKREAEAKRRLVQCTGLSKCGAIDYFIALSQPQVILEVEENAKDCCHGDPSIG